MNILLLIADDFGVPQWNSTNHPNLDRLRVHGTYYPHCWTHPVCSPSRASMYTGVPPYQHGLGYALGKGDDGIDVVGLGLETVAQLLAEAGFACGLFGKWHLGGDDRDGDVDPAKASFWPIRLGWHRHHGSLGGAVDAYDNWKCVSGDANVPPDIDAYTSSTCTTYATQAVAEWAVDWMNAQNTGTPFFCTIAFNAPHDPFHTPDRLPGWPPPAARLSEVSIPTGAAAELRCPTAIAGVEGETPTERAHQYGLMVEALDCWIGYVLDRLDPELRKNTTIFFVSDNGSPAEIMDPTREDYVKESIHRAGVHVPLLVHVGKAVRGPEASPVGESGALVHTMDLFATIASLAGVDAARSVAPHSHDFSGTFLRNEAGSRDYLFSQFFRNGEAPNVGATISDRKYKLNFQGNIVGDAFDLGAYPANGYELFEAGAREDEPENNLLQSDTGAIHIGTGVYEALEGLHAALLRRRPNATPTLEFPALPTILRGDLDGIPNLRHRRRPSGPRG